MWNRGNNRVKFMTLMNVESLRDPPPKNSQNGDGTGTSLSTLATLRQDSVDVSFDALGDRSMPVGAISISD